MMKAALVERSSPRPRRAKVMIILASLGLVALVSGAAFGVTAANDYPADNEAMQASAAADRAAVTEQVVIAQQAATDAAQSAEEAQGAVDSKVAAEQAAAAKRDAEAAAAAAATAEKAASGGSSSATDGAPRGTPLPFYPSSDPENAGGGDYADPSTFCAAPHSVSIINGVPQCDQRSNRERTASTSYRLSGRFSRCSSPTFSLSDTRRHSTDPQTHLSQVIVT